MEKLNNALAKIGLKPDELEGRAARKYAEYKKIFNFKTKNIRNEDGSLKPGAKQKLQDLGEDILELAVIQVESKNTPTPEPKPQPEPIPEPKPQPEPIPEPKKKDTGFFGFNIFK